MAAVGALYFTSQALDASRRQTALSEQGQYTDRFGRAVEQLGSDKLDVRLGGIYALQRLADDSPRDAITITRLLAAFVRDSTPCPAAPLPLKDEGLPRPSTDISAALTILSSWAESGRGSKTEPWVDVTSVCLGDRDLAQAKLVNFDLQFANLANSGMSLAQLKGVRLMGANLKNAFIQDSWWLGVNADAAILNSVDLRNSHISHCSFKGASLAGAKFDGAGWEFAGVPDFLGQWVDAVPNDFKNYQFRLVNFDRADLSAASLRSAKLGNSSFYSANLDGADFTGSILVGAEFGKDNEIQRRNRNIPGDQVRFDHADLTGASFAGRDMRRMTFFEANLTGANLSDADLRGVDLSHANLADANLTGAIR